LPHRELHETLPLLPKRFFALPIVHRLRYCASALLLKI